MSPTSVILRKIISGDQNYCCLCLQTSEDNFYNLQDEVILDIENAEYLYEIFSTVLGDQVVGCLSTNNMCHKCTVTAVNSYKFIAMCKNNVLNLASNVKCLEKYIKNLTDSKDCHKSLFMALDPQQKSVNYCIYDTEQYSCNERSLIQRFQCLRSEPQCITNINLITIDMEHEPSHTTRYDFSKEILNSVQLSDIIMCKNENDNKYKCKDCTKAYPTVLKIKQHYLRVHAPKSFKCSKCPRSFGSLLLLNRHSKNSHCTVVCSQCGKTYNNTYSLRHHENSHNTKLICQTCGKVYKGKQAFNNHIEKKLCHKRRKSNEEAKFICGYCQKRYSQKTALSIHIKIEHENGKALICDWCGKKFSSISRLKEHILKHTKFKNFSCDVCGGKFATKTSLLYHTRTHTGEKPYHCDQCDMRFLSASRRSNHVQRHHTKHELECDICHGKFKGQHCLNRHRKLHFNASSRLYLSSQVKEASINNL